MLTIARPLAAYAATACTNGLMASDPEADSGGTPGSGGSTQVQNGGARQTQSGGASTSTGGATTGVAAQSGGTTGVTGSAGAVACLPPLNDPRLEGEGFGLRLKAGLGRPSVDG
jgi:hypothetical protein